MNFVVYKLYFSFSTSKFFGSDVKITEDLSWRRFIHWLVDIPRGWWEPMHECE